MSLLYKSTVSLMSLSLPLYVFNPLYIYLRFADICKFFSQHIKIKMLSFDFIRQWPNFLPHHNEWKILACICVMNCKSSMNCFIRVWLIGSWSTTINFHQISTNLIYFKLNLTLNVCEERLPINIAGICQTYYVLH